MQKRSQPQEKIDTTTKKTIKKNNSFIVSKKYKDNHEMLLK